MPSTRDASHLRPRARLAGCAPSPEELDGLCEVSPGPGDAGFLRFVAPSIMRELIECLDGADCAARETCLMTTIERYNIDF